MFDMKSFQILLAILTTAVATQLGMSTEPKSSRSAIVEKHRPCLARYEAIYRDVHQHAELSCMEIRTAKVVGDELERLGYDVERGIGGHGVVGILKNGPGRTILLRSELDALPVKEQTGLPYASRQFMTDQYGYERPTMHACGHDMHLSCLLGAASLMISARDSWSGTLIVLFQPNEEHTGGAQAMLDDGLYDCIPIPDIVLGQHSNPIRTGKVNLRSGVVLPAADTVAVRVFGPSSETINPQAGLDPIGLAARIVVRLNDAVSHEIPPSEFAAVTCEEFHAGQQGLDYVPYADFKLDVKSYKPHVRQKLHAMIKRVILEECEAAGAGQEPEISPMQRAPLTNNDPQLVESLYSSFKKHFGDDLGEGEPRRPCEDFSLLATSVGKPYVFWFFGTVDAAKWDEAEREGKLGEVIALNHSPFYAPTIQPTMKTGVDAMALGALTFLM